MKEDGSQECIQVAAIRVPSSMENPVEAVTLHISLREYYLDVVANELGLEDAANVLISRNLGKASSEIRLFFAAPISYLLDPSSKFANGKETLHFEGPLNVKARYLSGQDIFGDAILACIGYTRKSRDLFYEDNGSVILQWPRILIVSTPNFEYNVVLQGLNPPSQEQEESDEKTLLQSSARHNYNVEFSGVGGSADVEPGFDS
ncbi:putative small RNA 2-O-methyltransferase [Sesbania bispinosa]|nr:putative small RNA 2-O-methyltransferase [Sesbania bispinosa]